MELLISLIIFLIVAALLLWIVQVIVSNLPIPVVAQRLIVALVALLLLLYAVQKYLGGMF